MARKKGVIKVRTSGAPIIIDALRPLRSAEYYPEAQPPTGAMLLEEQGAGRLIVPGTVERGRYSGLDALRARAAEHI